MRKTGLLVAITGLLRLVHMIRTGANILLSGAPMGDGSMLAHDAAGALKSGPRKSTG